MSDLTATGLRFFELLEPLAEDDEANGSPLAIYSDGYAAIVEPLADLVADADDGTPGWAAHLFDPDNEPAEWLPVTELFVGVNPLPAVDEAGRRLRIKHVDGRYRGTPQAIKNAARQFLIGPDGTRESATVYLNARVGGQATHFTVATLATETADLSLVQAAVAEQTPAGFQGTVTTITGGDYDTLRDTHVDYTDAAGQFATYDDMRANPALT